MFKKTLAMLLVALIVQMLCVQSAAASSKEEKQARQTEKVKAGIAKLGTGQEARVEIKLQDKTKVVGYISEANDDSFVVTNAKTGTATTVAYPAVRQVKGHNLSTGAKIAIGVAIGLAVYLVVGFILYTTAR